MKIQAVLIEANIADKIKKDPQRLKQLSIAYKHDHTMPSGLIAKIGPRPDPNIIADEWSKMLEDRLSMTSYGDASRDLKYPEWLTRLYVSGHHYWEDISGEGIDIVGAFNALDSRHMLNPQDNDIMRYKSLSNLHSRMRTYNDKLVLIRNEARIADAKRNRKEVVLIDNNEFWVAIPFNYGACYVFNNTMGDISNYCTGSSDPNWFSRYSKDGPIIMIVHKPTMDSANGKWQLHAATNQFNNSKQENRYNSDSNDKKFSELFPGLLHAIGDSISHHAGDITKLATEEKFVPSRYAAASIIREISEKFPISWKSRAEVAEPDAEAAPVAPENTEGPPADQLIGIDAQYLAYFAPEFANRISPIRPHPRRLGLTRTDGSIQMRTATGINDLLRQIQDEVPGWLLPRSIRFAGRVRGN